MKTKAIWRRVCADGPFVANTVLTAAANILIATLAIITGCLSARLLGPSGRGELAAIQTAPSFIATLAMLGMPEALVYFSAQEPTRASVYLGTASAFALTASIPFVVAAYPAMPLLVHAQSAEVVNASRWYLLIAPIWALAGMLPHTLRGTNNFEAWNASRVMVPVLAIIVIMSAWISGDVTPKFFAFGYLASYAFLFAPSLWLVRARIHGSYAPDRSRIAPMLAYGFPCMLTGVPQLLNLRLDQMLMAALLPARELGLYATAVAWSAAPAPVLNALAVVTTPAVASATSENDMGQRLAASTRTAMAMVLLFGLAFTLCTPLAIELLFGTNFTPAIPAAMLLVPAAAVLGLNLVLQEGLRGMGRPYAVFHAELAGLLVTAVTLAAILRPMGIMGAAIASLLGYATVCAVLLFQARRITCIPIAALLCPSMPEIQSSLAGLGRMLRDIIGLVSETPYETDIR
jgi:O-antigen/teichoic acid export membrane protein